MQTLKLRALGSRKSRRGATALEYALVLAFVAVAVLAAMTTLGGNITSAITSVGTKVQTAVADDFSA